MTPPSPPQRGVVRSVASLARLALLGFSVIANLAECVYYPKHKDLFETSGFSRYRFDPLGIYEFPPGEETPRKGEADPS